MERYLWMIWHFVSHRWTRYVAAWLAILGCTGFFHHEAYHGFDDRKVDVNDRRVDGNDGHTAIDFAGQWMMGRMLARGYGKKLYSRDHLYSVALEAFPRERESTTTYPHDADNIVIYCFVSSDKPKSDGAKESNRANTTRGTMMLPLTAADPLQAATLWVACETEYWTPDRIEEVHNKRLAGPLYPPTQAFLFAPFALSDNPQKAYRIMQWMVLGMAYLCGLGVSFLTRRKIWWPVATAMIVYFPGFAGSLYLGQNGALSLAILIWGWVLVSRNREGWAGIVWGLLAFKPVWAAAFLLVPILTHRWRMALAMACVGGLFALSTLPFVGLDTWIDWLQIGKAASETYDVDTSWIFLSRDLLSIPRRFLINFDESAFDRDRWYIQLASWTLLVLILETMVRLTQMLKIDWRATTGPAAAFLLLGAWMCCFHFMYYDALLAALGFIVLLAAPGRFIRPLFVLFRAPTLEPNRSRAWTEYLRPRLARTHPDLVSPMPMENSPTGSIWVANSLMLYALMTLIAIQTALPYFAVTATLQAARIPQVKVTTPGENGPIDVLGADRQPLMRNRQLIINTDQAGPPWETYCLMGLWAWAGICAIGRVEKPER
jgi:arabinofuranan 3-O-arabinosyltransferase